MTPSTSPSRTEKVGGRVCVVCGASLTDHRPHARHCSPACRVEAHRISAILRGTYSGPYRSVLERLQAAQKAYKGPLVGNDDGALEDNNPSVRKTAIGKLISDTIAARLEGEGKNWL